LENIMNIGQASSATGVSSKMIRYYESIGLIRQSRRTDSGYRTYGDNDLHTLRFIKRARKLGFSLEQIRDLLSLWGDLGRASADVKAIAQAHVADLQKRIVELTEMRDTLSHLAHACSGDHRPECPILVGLADESPAESGHEDCVTH
jgi:MerR family copper efflux transcriptional regulator